MFIFQSIIVNISELLNFYTMNFRTEINLKKSSLLIDHSSSILTIGSCFAENIAGYFSELKFNVMENPFGVLYNPASIYNSLKLVNDNKHFTAEDLFQHDSEFHSFFHHSDFSHHNSEVCLNNINKGIKTVCEFLSKSDVITITYGTSFVYQHKKLNRIVSNCHKISQKEFDRYMLSLDQVSGYIFKTVELLRKFNPKMKIIFTVSPIRHWKDGAVENQLSKATLLLAINQFVNETNVEYFPSYEIMMDDLRDYRFYEKDMLHPNKIAVEYIWEKFREAYLSQNCIEIIKQIEKLNSAFNHRPRNTNSEKHQQFLRTQLKLIDELLIKYKYIDFREEKVYFESLII
ncbi:MAG: GSCFA domain-containing protein [Melioribacteraceae bacterium]|nr:GSCFA domain-containing protein [Melioribacteraceae bacterium]